MTYIILKKKEKINYNQNDLNHFETETYQIVLVLNKWDENPLQ
jgi:hypothetical protein